MIDEDGEHQQARTNDTDDKYEVEDEAQDPESPYPPIVAELNLGLETEVLHLAVPSIVPSNVSRLSQSARTNMVVALATSNTTIKLMMIPLEPPAPGTQEEYLEDHVTEIDLQGSRSIARDLAVKIKTNDKNSTSESNRTQESTSNEADALLVASIGTSLTIWNLPSSSAQPRAPIHPQIQMPISGAVVSFQSSPRLDSLLLAETSGLIRVFNPQEAQRLTSSDSATASSVSPQAHGRWVMSYQTPFHGPENSNPALARRKKVLSAAWVLGGRGTLVLLEDGQWGVWDVSGNSQASGKSVQDFTLHGYLNTSSTSEASSNPSQKRSIGSKLAPMTPNTRKAKAENLFAGSPKPINAASSGGISVTITQIKAGQLDESVVIWYNNSIYSINSMQSFWQRSQVSSDRSSFGGLYAPGLTHVTDINLINENITSISQFAPRSTIAPSTLGQMNMQNDLLVSAEHRYIILQHLRPQGLTREQLQHVADRPLSRDQRMLDVGEADLGGMNRILDGMAGDGRVRRVGFAS
jgi:hypothetical protein